MKIYKINSDDTEYNNLIELSAEDCLAWIENLEIGDKVMIEAIEMEQHEINNLPIIRD